MWCDLVIDLGTGVRELRKRVEEAEALRAPRYRRLFRADPNDSGSLKALSRNFTNQFVD